MNDLTNLQEDSICFNCYMFCHCGYHGKSECEYFKQDSNKVKYIIYNYGDYTVIQKDITDRHTPIFKGTAKECIKWAKENNKKLSEIYYPHSVYQKIDS